MTSDFDQNLVIDESNVMDRSMNSNIDDEEEDDDFCDELVDAGEIVDGASSYLAPSEFLSPGDDDNSAGGNLSDVRRSCNVCELSFYSMRQLSDHLRESHGIDKPFQCHVCKARFPYSSSLYNHTRIHSERKPFSCDQCEAAFRWKNSLKHHKRFIHKVMDPADLEKLNETTFSGNVRAPKQQQDGGGPVKKSRSKKPATRVSIGVLPNPPEIPPNLPMKLLMASAAASGGLRSMFPQPTPQILENSSAPETITLHEEEVEEDLNGKNNSANSAHTCGHCGEKFEIWQALAKHLVGCEKINTAESPPQPSANKIRKIQNNSESGGGSFYDTFTTYKPPLNDVIVEEIVETHAETSKSTENYENSAILLAKIEHLERKYAQLERNTNERIARLEATVADLYEVAAESEGLI